MREAPKVFLEGIDVVIKRDLAKHKGEKARRGDELIAYKTALATLISRKRHYRGLIGTGKYDDKAMVASIEGINVDIRAMQDKIKLTKEASDHHTMIVDKLSEDLSDYNRDKDAIIH